MIFSPNFSTALLKNRIVLVLLPMKSHCMAKFREYRFRDSGESWLEKKEADVVVKLERHVVKSNIPSKLLCHKRFVKHSLRVCQMYIFRRVRFGTIVAMMGKS